eukprot:TRINITY_DN10075_c0_g1_i1.p1 TRINITY_DN10075_c0_g1~~TRINITY_DN10075_c0_g1_i1.p1  ORF type:complete len:174 (+),score=23.66 TRINITY_DN10075_c0_g1_i1:24-524(+)
MSESKNLVFDISPVETPAEIAAVAELFRIYAASLGVDLGYQSFEDEVANLPGKYARPSGALLLARGACGSPVGCVALRALPIEATRPCEMKRLYVAPNYRGAGLGRALVDAAIAHARKVGYDEVRLDTLPFMHRAMALYTSAGFLPIPAYYSTPVEGTVFLGLRLK